MPNNKKEKNINPNIIRIKPKRKGFQISTLVIFIIISFILTIAINSFLNFNSQGEEVPLSEIVTIISEGEYEESGIV